MNATAIALAIVTGAVQGLVILIVLKVDMRWLKGAVRHLTARVDLLEGRKAPLPSTIGE
jgi:hypothetical protein